MPHHNLQQLLKKHFGYDSFRPAQEAVIRAAMSGRDTLVLMPTGGGKSICYQLPSLAFDGLTIVVSPLISLMKDQVEALQANGIPAGALNSTLSVEEAYRLRTDCTEGRVKLLYMSPETLLGEIPYLLQSTQVSLIAVDEAHCVSQWGHDFRPEYTRLAVLREAFPGVPVMALTATADKVTRTDIITQLALREPFVSVSSFDRPNLSLAVLTGYRKRDKLRHITSFISHHKAESGIIYCLSRRTAEELCAELKAKGIECGAYHAGLSNAERERVQTDFIRDNLQVVCATIAFGMGIDKSNVRWVIHYNLPKSIESFFQEIGRAGRDGAPAETLLFYSYQDIILLEGFARDSGQREINMERLARMREYAEAGVCRRRILLNYFGEESSADCGNCDVCRNPPHRFDGTVLAQKALSAVVRTEQKAGLQLLADILHGNYTPAVREARYTHIKTFGAGRDLPTRDWREYIMQMIQLGLLEIAYDDNYHLRITGIGEDVLYGRATATLALVVPKEAPKPSSPTKKAPKTTHTLPIESPALSHKALTEELFETLRLLRKSIADSQGLKPYIIMSDATMRIVAAMRPDTLEAFGQISGIGEYKRKKYGNIFIGAIKQFMKKRGQA